MSFRQLFYIAIALWLAVQPLGCAWFQPKKEKTAQELAEEGAEAFRDKDYTTAIKYFEKLKDWYPFSQYSILAELKLGDAHYHLKEYEEAISAYKEFENLHPKNEAVPYVVYQIGHCYFDRLYSIDRDQTMAREALQAFERLIHTYPASSYVKQAKEHIAVCNRNLAEHEFYVGMFYYKSKHYKAALERFKTVLRSYTDQEVHRKALEYIPLCQDGIDDSIRGKN